MSRVERIEGEVQNLSPDELKTASDFWECYPSLPPGRSAGRQIARSLC